MLKKNSNNTIMYFELVEKTEDEFNVLTEVVRIEKTNEFHEKGRDFDYWFYLRNDSNWKRCLKTGMSYTILKNVFEGNIPEKLVLNQKNRKGKDWEIPKDLVFIQVDHGAKELVVDVFPGHYIFKKRLINLLLKEHRFYFETIRKYA